MYTPRCNEEDSAAAVGDLVARFESLVAGRGAALSSDLSSVGSTSRRRSRSCSSLARGAGLLAALPLEAAVAEQRLHELTRPGAAAAAHGSPYRDGKSIILAPAFARWWRVCQWAASSRRLHVRAEEADIDGQPRRLHKQQLSEKKQEPTKTAAFSSATPLRQAHGMNNISSSSSLFICGAGPRPTAAVADGPGSWNSGLEWDGVAEGMLLPEEGGLDGSWDKEAFQLALIQAQAENERLRCQYAAQEQSHKNDLLQIMERQELERVQRGSGSTGCSCACPDCQSSKVAGRHSEASKKALGCPVMTCRPATEKMRETSSSHNSSTQTAILGVDIGDDGSDDEAAYFPVHLLKEQSYDQYEEVEHYVMLATGDQLSQCESCEELAAELKAVRAEYNELAALGAGSLAIVSANLEKVQTDSDRCPDNEDQTQIAPDDMRAFLQQLERELQEERSKCSSLEAQLECLAAKQMANAALHAKQCSSESAASQSMELRMMRSQDKSSTHRLLATAFDREPTLAQQIEQELAEQREQCYQLASEFRTMTTKLRELAHFEASCAAVASADPEGTSSDCAGCLEKRSQVQVVQDEMLDLVRGLTRELHDFGSKTESQPEGMSARGEVSTELHASLRLSTATGSEKMHASLSSPTATASEKYHLLCPAELHARLSSFTATALEKDRPTELHSSLSSSTATASEKDRLLCPTELHARLPSSTATASEKDRLLRPTELHASLSSSTATASEKQPLLCPSELHASLCSSTATGSETLQVALATSLKEDEESAKSAHEQEHEKTRKLVKKLEQELEEQCENYNMVAAELESVTAKHKTLAAFESDRFAMVFADLEKAQNHLARCSEEKHQQQDEMQKLVQLLERQLQDERSKCDALEARLDVMEAEEGAIKCSSTSTEYEDMQIALAGSLEENQRIHCVHAREQANMQELVQRLEQEIAEQRECYHQLASRFKDKPTDHKERTLKDELLELQETLADDMMTTELQMPEAHAGQALSTDSTAVDSETEQLTATTISTGNVKDRSKVVQRESKTEQLTATTTSTGSENGSFQVVQEGMREFVLNLERELLEERRNQESLVARLDGATADAQATAELHTSRCAALSAELEKTQTALARSLEEQEKLQSLSHQDQVKAHKQIEQLEHELEEQRERYGQLAAELKGMAAKHHQLSALDANCLSAVSAELEQAKSDLSKYSEQKDQVELERVEMCKRIQHLERQLKDERVKRELLELKTVNKTTTAEFNSAIQHCSSCTKLEKAQITLADIWEEKERMRRLHAREQDVARELLMQVEQQLEKQCERSKQLAAELQAMTANRKDQAVLEAKCLAMASADLNQAKYRLAKCSEENRGLRVAQDEMYARVQQLEHELEEERGKRSLLVAQVDKMTSRHGLEEEMRWHLEEQEKSCTRLRKEIEALAASRDVDRVQLTSTKALLEDQREQNAQLQAKLLHAQTQLRNSQGGGKPRGSSQPCSPTARQVPAVRRAFPEENDKNFAFPEDAEFLSSVHELLEECRGLLTLSRHVAKEGGAQAEELRRREADIRARLQPITSRKPFGINFR
eukprot:TRINITY_DN87115_c0_g1_i1.p1 TRINITY_DN87115_c0_g1~~TRINITY_DN87115_c0_g1_i1.p1  ORF type:complete len:1564 (-),score=421.70 TRINITY_DN87115_c0_g1_i1:100-4791(-)